MNESNGKSQLKNDSAAKSISELFYSLSLALNCKHSKLDFCKDFYGQPEPTVNLQPKDFQELFRRMHASDECLLENRYKLFLHLYRLLLKLEPDEAKFQQYLLFCYDMFDEEEPVRMHQEDVMLYNEKLTETLISLARSMMFLNESTLTRTTDTKACKIGYVQVENIPPAPMKRCEVKGLRWEGAGSKINSIPGRSQIPRINTKYKIASKQGEPKEKKEKISSSNVTKNKYGFRGGAAKSANRKDTAEVGCQFIELAESLDKSKCQLRRIRETAEFGCQFMSDDRRVVSNMAQQTEMSRAMSDQSVQTCGSSSCSDLSLTNTVVKEMRGSELNNYFNSGDLLETPRATSSSNINSDYAQDLTCPLNANWRHFLLSTFDEMLPKITHPSTEFPMNEHESKRWNLDDFIGSSSEQRLPKINANTSDEPEGQGYNVLVLPTLEHDERMEQMGIQPKRTQRMNQSQQPMRKAHSEEVVEGLGSQLKLLAKSLLAREEPRVVKPEQPKPISKAWQQAQGCAASAVISDRSPGEIRFTENIFSQFDVSELLIDNQLKYVNERPIPLEKSLRELKRTVEMLTKVHQPTELRGADTPINLPISITDDNTQLQISEISTADLSDADQKIKKEVGKAETPSRIDDRRSIATHKDIVPIIQQSLPSEDTMSNFTKYIVKVLQQSINELDRSSLLVSIPHSQLPSSLEKLSIPKAESIDEAIRPQSKPLDTRYNAETHLEPLTRRSVEPEVTFELPSSDTSQEHARGSPYSSHDQDVEYDCQSFLPAVTSPVRWEHCRYIIAASRFISKQFKCNPAYQCSLLQPDGPNFYEQWSQFQEIAASPPSPKLNVREIRKRLRSSLKRKYKEYALQNANQFVAMLAQCQLRQLLNQDELEQYDALRWQLRDRGQAVPLTPEQRIENAISAMLGQPSQQLRVSALGPSLMLRSPHHQESISESYLLLALAEVGYYYRCLKQRQRELLQLGDCARALAPCLLAELGVYARFCHRQKKQPTSLIGLFWKTRCYLYRFGWMMKLFDDPCQRPSLMQRLQLQIGLGDADNDILVMHWLQCAAEPFLAKLSRWLLVGELPQDDFFIVQRDGNSPENYWQQEFQLVPEEVPHFLEMQHAQRLLITGRNRHYSREYLDLDLVISVQDENLQRRLSDACAKSYGELDKQPLEDLINYLELCTSMQLFDQLEYLCPQPMQLFSQLYQYLMLTDVEFVRKLIELLEPALEQPAKHFSASLLNSMLEQLQNDQNERLYVDRSSGQGSRCWCCFVLRWHHVHHWMPLIGDCKSLYESCFVSLWQLHYADYVLNERISRQQSHIWERISLESSHDARMVRDRFDEIIERLQAFILNMRRYIMEEVLANEFDNLYLSCKGVHSIHELLELHGAYLRNIHGNLWLIGDWCSRLRSMMQHLYDPIFQLDEVQQKFLSLCQFFKGDGATQSQEDLRWSCQNTLDAINDLDKAFEKVLEKFLLALLDTDRPQLSRLAKTLAATGQHNKKHNES